MVWVCRREVSRAADGNYIDPFFNTCLLLLVGGRGEHSPPGPNGEFDISNKGRIGASEVK